MPSVFQVREDSMSTYPIDVSEDLRDCKATRRDQVNVVGHYHVGENEESSRLAGFIYSRTSNRFDFLGPEHRKPIPGNRRKIVGRGVRRNPEHG